MNRHAHRLYHSVVLFLCFAIILSSAVPASVVADSLPPIALSPNKDITQDNIQLDQNTLESATGNPQERAGSFDPSLTWEPLPWQQVEPASPFQPLLTNASTVIQITDAGFSPATLNLFGPSDVTWINSTAVTQTVRSGIPQITPTVTPVPPTVTPIPPTPTPVLPTVTPAPGVTPAATSAVFLPVVASPKAGNEQQSQFATDPAIRLGLADDTLIAILPPGAAYTRRFIDPTQLSFYLEGAPQFTGALALTRNLR